jgi:hypothetical protein
VRALQHEWQGLAQAVPLERKLEQKLWDAFRKPIDEAFQRKDAAREKQASAMSAHDQRVLAAAQALQAANASQDAQKIQAAMAELDAAMRGQAQAVQAAAASVAAPSEKADSSPAVVPQGEADAAPASGEASAEPDARPTPAPAPARKVVAVRGDDRPGMKKAEPAPAGRGQRPGDARGPRSGREDRDARSPGRRESAGRDGDARFQDRGPRLGDAAFRAQRDAVEQAQLALKKLAAQAHGQSLTQLLEAWRARDASVAPSAAELGSRVNASVRQAWLQSLAAPAGALPSDALLRLEMAAEVPTPAAHVDARRALQLQLLTRRHDAPPAQTWPQDAGRVLAAEWSEEAARRLQQALKPLLRRV